MKNRSALKAPGATALALLLLFGCGGDDDPTDPGGTGDTTAPAAVSDLSVTSVAGTVVNLAWTAPGDDGATGLATSYDLRVSNETLTEANWAAGTRIVMGVPSPATAGVAQTAAVDVAGRPTATSRCGRSTRPTTWRPSRTWCPPRSISGSRCVSSRPRAPTTTPA